jgi:hypothetical protein
MNGKGSGWYQRKEKCSFGTVYTRLLLLQATVTSFESPSGLQDGGQISLRANSLTGGTASAAEIKLLQDEAHSKTFLEVMIHIDIPAVEVPFH